MESIFDTAKNEGIIESETRCEAIGRIENITKKLKSLISKNHSFQEPCELLDVDEETKEMLLDSGEFSICA